MNNKQWILKYGNAILAIIFGLIALLYTNLAVKSLAIYFAGFLLAGGVFQIIHALAKKQKAATTWFSITIQGIIEIVFGLVILFNPTKAASVFMLILGLWILLIGVVFFFSLLQSPPTLLRSILLIISAVVAILGLITIIHPFEITRFITIVVGLFSLGYGILTIAGLRLIRRK